MTTTPTSSQLALLQSEFGRAYTDRNDVAKPERVATWKRVLGDIAPVRVVEVGCNVGWNLVYLKQRSIIAFEYDAPVEQKLTYRGKDEALCDRDHGALWQAQYPDLKLVRRIELGEADGYDDCTAHVFEKTT